MGILAAGAGVLAAVTWSIAQLLPAPVELVSVNFGGRAGDATSNGPSISADGNFVAFFSDAADLVFGDTNEARDVFVRNRADGRTERVSVNTAGVQGNLGSHTAGDNPSINADGSIVAFYSNATNLVPGDTNDQSDVFVRLRNLNVTERVSVSSSGAQGNGPSLSASISGSGRLVAFQSLASNLIAGDTNEVTDVFVRDRISATTERLCNHVQGNGASFQPAISADGNVVAFTSAANNLVGNDTNRSLDVFVCDRRTNQIDIVSVSTNDDLGNGDSILPAISADGRFVAFKSIATNLVPDDRNNEVDVFVRDRVNRTTERISVSFLNRDSNGVSFAPDIDCTGRFVVYGTQANNIVRNDYNQVASLILRDRAAGLSFLVDINERGEQANGPVLDIAPAISCTNLLIAYATVADNLTRNDFNQHGDVYVQGAPVPTCREDADCDDQNLCTTDSCGEDGRCINQADPCQPLSSCHDAGVCDPQTGICSNPIKPDGATCDDGNLCTSGDQCTGGVCSGSAKDCSMADACHDAGACDPATGLCPNPRPDGTPCDDGDLCSSGDQCIGSICTGRPKDCSVADECHDAGVCDPATGLCPNPRPDGTPCDDDDLCTKGDRCEGSICTGNPKDCSVADACHDAGECNPETGLCPNPRPDGTPCDDANLCTSGDRCDESICEGTPKDCSTADGCHDAGACNPATGLCPNPRPDGTPCSDGQLCTTGDQCTGSICRGTPKNCSMADACHDAGECNPQTGLCPNPRPDGTPCSDGMLCTIDDQCTGSICNGAPKDCSMADACHDAGACNPATGLCPNPRPDGTPCSDGMLCTIGDQCTGSICRGRPKDCSMADACHDAGACNPATGLCPNPRPDGTPCSDGMLCTIDDQCTGSICNGTPKDCSMADACHDAGACNPATGLCPNPRPDGTPCSDGMLCTIGDQCTGSICRGSPKDCSRADGCHDAGACNPATGLCPNARPDGTPCNDGNLCTNGDQCTGSICDGSPIDCSMADECHDAGACNPATGLCPNPRPDGTPCNDGNLCTSGDQCTRSRCGGTPKDCSVADDCHDAGMCNPATGLCPNARPDGTPCSSGRFCLVSESCSGSFCQGEPRNCDNGVFCDGTESCDEEGRRCVSSGNPCPPDKVCNESKRTCDNRIRLDKDSCSCDLDPNAQRSRTAAWIWVSAVLALALRRRVSGSRS
jgi:Tol biopolymer transport system component